MLSFFKHLLHGSIVYGIGSGATQLVGFLLVPLYTRLLTPQDYGHLEILVTTASVLTILLLFGMQNSLFRFSFDSSDAAHKKLVLSTTNVFVWCVTAVLVGILALNANHLGTRLLGQTGHALSVLIVLAFAGVAATQYIAKSVLRINNQPIPYARISLLEAVLKACLGILLVAGLQLGYVGALIGSFTAAGLGTALSYYLIRQHLQLRFSWPLCRQMLRYGLPFVPAALSILIMTFSDRYFLLAYSDAAELGLYSVGARFASAVALAIGAFRLAWPEAALSILHQKDRDSTYARSLTYFIFVGCVMVLGLSLFGEPLLRLMTPPEYHDGAKVIPLLSLGLVFNGSASIVAVGRIVTKRMATEILVTGIPAGLNLALNWLLVPPFGMMGAAWATMGSFALMALLSWYASNRLYHIDYEWPRLAKALLPLAVLLALAHLVHIDQAPYDMLFRAAVFIAYFAVLLALKWPKVGEMQYVKMSVKRLPRPKTRTRKA
jgi:O-antigen/teichoic acid export membrane protein